MSTERSSVVTGTDFVCVMTRDYEAAKKFYGEVLGLRFSKAVGQASGRGV